MTRIQHKTFRKLESEKGFKSLCMCVSVFSLAFRRKSFEKSLLKKSLLREIIFKKIIFVWLKYVKNKFRRMNFVWIE